MGSGFVVFDYVSTVNRHQTNVRLDDLPLWILEFTGIYGIRIA